MNYDNLDLNQFIPDFMKTDTTSQGFAYAVKNQINKVILAIAKAQIYGNIDSLNDTVLDELAWQFNIPEYSSTLDLTTKRILIKKCMLTHKIRGTKGAVEKVVNDIFGDGYVEEWFDYNGSEYHFRVVTSNPSVTSDQANLFLEAINNVKRGSTVMDAVIIDLSAQANIFYGTVLQIGDFYTTEQVV